MKTYRLGVAGCGFVAASAVASAAGMSRAQSLTNLGVLPNASSSNVVAFTADGSIVAGTSGNPSRAFTWTPKGGLRNLGTLSGFSGTLARDISGDGTTVVGETGVTNEVWRAVRWTEATGHQDLGVLGPPDVSSAEAGGVNADGSVVVGTSYTPTRVEAFRWTTEVGMEGIGIPPQGTRSAAFDTDASGNVVVGNFGLAPFGTHGFRWTPETSFTDLGTLMTGGSVQVREVSDDGRVVVGYATTSQGDRAFRWSIDDPVMRSIGVLPGYDRSEAGGTTHDGSVIVGRCTASGGLSRPFIWSEATGMLDLPDFLDSRGIDTTGWSLIGAFISPDGSTIGGTGRIDGALRGWVMALPQFPCCTADFNCDQDLTSQDFFGFLAAFFNLDASADTNSDGVVDSQDFFGFLSRFFAGC